MLTLSGPFFSKYLKKGYSNEHFIYTNIALYCVYKFL